MTRVTGNRDMDQKPLVSVIIPAFNAEKTIGETVRSVLRQTHGHIEVIVVDDGSTDRTRDIVRKTAFEDARVRVIHQENVGVAGARNRGIAASSGTLVAPIDADDIWFSRHLEKQVARISRTDTPVDVVYGWSLEMDQESRLSGGFHCGRFEGSVFLALLQGFFIGHASATLIRRKCFSSVGDYDSNLRAAGAEGCEDWDLYLRLAERFRFGAVCEFTIGYRYAPGNMSTRQDTMERSYDMVLEKLRLRRPNIPNHWFRRSKANFRLYLAMRSLENGQLRKQMHYVRHALVLDPPAVLLRHDVWFGFPLWLISRCDVKANETRTSILARRIRTQPYLPYLRLHDFRLRHIPGLNRLAGFTRRRTM